MASYFVCKCRLYSEFVLYKALHLSNTFWVYIIPGAVCAFNMFIIILYIKDIPDSLEESAQLDGAGYFTIFTKYISPICKPVYSVIALFVGVWQWNDFATLLFYMGDVSINRATDKSHHT